MLANLTLQLLGSSEESHGRAIQNFDAGGFRTSSRLLRDQGPFRACGQTLLELETSEATKYKHILICTDGSDVAQKGIDHGLSLAKSIGAKVTIVTVTERFPLHHAGMAGAGWVPGPTEIANYDAAQKDWADKVLTLMKASAEKLGVAADTVHVPDALPAEAIVETARTHGCSLIVMSSHGRRGLRRFLLGSQTSEVLVVSPVPVLVVR
jgi:nucleotide-binding universal stress UspA family protein